MCRQELVVERTERDRESIVGEECHIVSGAPQGPRHIPGWTSEQYDELDNLVLFCSVHHKMVDDQRETYTIELLRQMKADHEKWVVTRLTETTEKEIPPVRLRKIKGQSPEHLLRITSGQALLNIVLDAHAYEQSNDEIATKEEAALVGGFLQEVKEWGESGDDLEPVQRVEAELALTNSIKELEAGGFWVFGGREVRSLEGGVGPPSAFPIAIVRVVRNGNPLIVSIDPSSFAEGMVDPKAADCQQSSGDSESHE